MSAGGPGSTDYQHVAMRVLADAHAVVRPGDVVYVTSGVDIEWISDSVRDALGWEPADLIGQPALSLLSPNQDRSFVDVNRHRLLAGHDIVQSVLAQHRNGSEHWFSGVAHPVPGATGVSGFVAVMHAISANEAGAGVGPLIDEVTGVESRQSILDFLDSSMSGPDADLCMLMVEFGNLAVVNESVGHAIGDAALSAFAHRMRDTLLHGERVGRVSGKTFLVSCRHVRAVEDLRMEATRLVQAWSEPLPIDGRVIQPDVIAAVVPARAGSTSLTLLRDADVALSVARRDGGTVTMFDPEMADRAVRRFVLEDELRFAIDADEFDLYFQPIVSLTDEAVVAAEALVRWNHPREGLLSPPSFLQVAEESRLIRPIGQRVLARALTALENLPPHAMQIGVNVSAVELSHEDWVGSVTRALDDADVDPCCLVLEITETAVLAARRDVRADLELLRERGVSVFLDDFGTGYSSLAMLRDLPVSGIKLDKSFVSALDSDDAFGAALTQGIVDLIRPLGLAGVAEGIETERQAELLADLGWGFGQGFYFGRPGPFSALPPGRVSPHASPPG